MELIPFKEPKKDKYEDEPQYDYKKGGYCPIDENSNINSYTIIEKLGWGSYSTVWKAKKNDNIYAIKIQKSNKDDTELAEKEVKTLYKFVNKSHIVQLHDTFKYKSRNGKHICIVMDVLGYDLHEFKHQYKYKDNYYMESSKSDSDTDNEDSSPLQCIPVPVVKHIIKQILIGLNIIHSNNYIHTDIKLENILLDRPITSIKTIDDINVKIADFGTAIKTSDKSNYEIGTLHYCAPELMLGLSYSTGIDVWAVGCLIFELISGECLFDYGRYYDEASDFSSGETISDFDSDDDEDDKVQLEFLLLSMMSQVLGKIPYKLYKRAKYYSIFFDSRGRFRYYPKYITESNLLQILEEDCQFDNIIAKKINDLLLNILVYDQDKRLNCLEIIDILDKTL
tara:strand:- start:6819 stop:8003 length:1185 start_codon:yes stop_codon:yes gene_type:complete